MRDRVHPSEDLQAARRRVSLLGVEIDALTMSEAVEACEGLIARRSPSLVLPMNVDVYIKIRQDPELKAIFRQADLVLADGTPMMWAAALLGTPLPGRVSGSDFVPEFCATAAEKGYRVFFLGAAPGIAEQAKQFLQCKHPALDIVGTYAPPLGFDTDRRETARAITHVRDAAPDVLFAAFGAPKQEEWLFRNRAALGVPVSMGVGSSLDYLAGRLKRSPMWMQKLGLEWAYRLVQEPRRLWRRYLLHDPPFVYFVLREMVQRRTRRRYESP